MMAPRLYEPFGTNPQEPHGPVARFTATVARLRSWWPRFIQPSPRLPLTPPIDAAKSEQAQRGGQLQRIEPMKRPAPVIWDGNE